MQVELPPGLSVVPGPAGGEGCSLEGGCASCPFMKMNSLQALMTGGRGRAVLCRAVPCHAVPGWAEQYRRNTALRCVPVWFSNPRLTWIHLAPCAVCDRVGSPAGEATLEAFKPRPYAELVDGKTMAQVGSGECLIGAQYAQGLQLTGSLAGPWAQACPCPHIVLPPTSS